MSPNAAWQTTLIETDVAPAGGSSAAIAASIDANEIKTYRFTVGPEDPENIQLMVARGSEGTDVDLSWSGAFPAFAVMRSQSPAPGGSMDLTPPEGTDGFSWIDPGVLQDDNTYYYLIDILP